MDSEHHVVKNLREERGIKQKHLARKAGISREALSRIERGITTPSTKTLIELARVLDIPIAKLLEGERGD
jgi:transcriptional regulator with XRE-family HTH domain